MNQLKQLFQKELVYKLAKEQNVKNPLAVPCLEKIVVNMGVGQFKDNEKYLENARHELAMITGQRPSRRYSKKAISGFKLRRGDLVGLTVTLRGERMWDFFEKLIAIVLPRVRDFRGLKKGSFDGKGNYTLGLEEHTAFVEVDANKTDRTKSLEVIIVTTAKDNEKACQLLESLGMPFRKE